MFDLFRSRAKAVRYMLGGMLLLVAISMVVTLIPGFGSGAGASDQVVAEIGKDVLSLREVQMQVQRAMRNKAFPAEMVSVFVPEIVTGMITERAVAYQARRLGFDVSESDLAAAIVRMLPQLFQDGKFVGREAYAQFLAQQNISMEEFERDVREQILVSKLRRLVIEGVVVAPDEIEKEFRRRNAKIKLEYLALPAAKYRAEVKATPEEIASHYKNNAAAYRMPEKRSFQMLVIDEAKVGQMITVPEPELRRAYQANLDNYRLPERVHVRHILLKTTDKPKEEIPKIQARAEELLKQVKGGADFAELAKKHSEDTGTAVKGGDLDWIVRGQTVKAFEDAAFSLKPKEISSVIKTEYGFHVLQVLEKEAARVKPFEEVKEQIAQERKRQMVFDRMQELADQARAALQKTPEQAREIAQKLNVQLVTVDKAGPGDPVPEIGVNRELEGAIQALQKSEVTQPIPIQGNKLVVAVLTEVHPTRQAQLAEVEDQIRQQLTNSKTNGLLEQRAREAFQKAKGGEDLKALAKALGVELKTTQEFTIDGAADGIGSASVVYDGFSKQQGDVFGPIPVGDQRFICKVVAKIPPDLSKLPEQRAQIQQTLKSQKARERNELFEEGLRNQLIKEGKIKIHQDVVSRLVASYRG